MPALLLQPLVENAIRHGLEPKVGGGRIDIRAAIDDGRLRIRVEDDGLGLDAPRAALRPGSGMALANIRARLRHRYGERATLVLAGREAGASATIELPYQART
jgi:LytS/YehU family sensor histidine kinase